MNIAIPKEIVEGERRVALTPDTVKRIAGDSVTVQVEKGAGLRAGFGDDAYVSAGAEIVADPAALWGGADLLLKIHIPMDHPATGKHEADMLRAGAPLVGTLQPLVKHDGVRKLASAGVNSFSLDALPRITRAQSMDVLSSMSTVAGYKAVLIGASHLGKFLPMLVTAAGTMAPAKVLVLGAGVAGLQAIATARRLGGVVTAFDVRAAVKEQVESLGARFLEVDMGADAEDAGGYATALSEEQHQKEVELLHEHTKDIDLVITTALIPGKPAPKLITDDMIRDMRLGSVILDLAAEMGGNAEGTVAGETVERHGVTIVGPLNLASTMPTHASMMYSKNTATFVKHITEDGNLKLDYDDEITGATNITRDGQIVHEATRNAMEGGQ